MYPALISGYEVRAGGLAWVRGGLNFIYGPIDSSKGSHPLIHHYKVLGRSVVQLSFETVLM